MNKNRRAEIAKAMGMIEEAKAKLAEAAAILTAAGEEEREYHDNMPEGLKSGEKGEVAEAAANALEEAGQSLEEVAGTLDEVFGKCEEAVA